MLIVTGARLESGRMSGPDGEEPGAETVTVGRGAVDFSRKARGASTVRPWLRRRKRTR